MPPGSGIEKWKQIKGKRLLMSRLLATGRNCDSIINADRIRFLVDSNDYFHILRESIKRAQHAVYILSWDIDSSVALVRDDTNDGYPARLGEFLNAIVAEKPRLHVYILNWDFAVLFLLDREFLPVYKLDWKTHRRVHFKLDDQQPSGASQHQKVVVIDDALAFVGGLDLTRGRWDTSDHLPFNEKRDHIGQKPSRPYHDVQVLVAGDCAGALGNMARQNWLNATGQKLHVFKPGDVEGLWPDSVPVDIEHVPVGISYTYARFKNRQEIRQIQQLYVDAILSAKKYIYLENQYFTSPAVGKAIQRQLERKDGPEIILVTPKITDGWLSQYTMDILRVRLINRLKKSDKRNRFRVYFPDGPGLDKNPINVHAKVMVVDDTLVTVGSANLNNRSMALDNECNLFIHADNKPVVQHELAGLRNRLLAEHLGCERAKLEDMLRDNNSLITTIGQLNNTEIRHLSNLPLELPKDVDQYVPDSDIVDPEHPLEMESLVKKIIPEQEQIPARKHILNWMGIAALLLALAGLWRWTPLKGWINPETISSIIGQIRNLPAAPILVISGFVIAGLVAFPFSLLIIACVITFGSLWGFVYALTGGILSAITTYGIGNFAGRNTVRKLAGPRLNQISKKLAQHGKLTIVTIRIVPVAPFTIINLVAGASHINFRDYFTGTILGMTPGMLAISILVDRTGATIRDPNLTNAGILAIVIGAVALAAFGLVKWLSRKVSDKASP
jgi:phospholipase D1/2